jgi:hypothetical protein
LRVVGLRRHWGPCSVSRYVAIPKTWIIGRKIGHCQMDHAEVDVCKVIDVLSNIEIKRD